MPSFVAILVSLGKSSTGETLKYRLRIGPADLTNLKRHTWVAFIIKWIKMLTFGII